MSYFVNRCCSPFRSIGHKTLHITLGATCLSPVAEGSIQEELRQDLRGTREEVDRAWLEKNMIFFCHSHVPQNEMEGSFDSLQDNDV